MKKYLIKLAAAVLLSPVAFVMFIAAAFTVPIVLVVAALLGLLKVDL